MLSNIAPNVSLLSLIESATKSAGILEGNGRTEDGTAFAVIVVTDRAAANYQVPGQRLTQRLATHLGLVQMQQPTDALGKTVVGALTDILRALLLDGAPEER